MIFGNGSVAVRILCIVDAEQGLAEAFFRYLVACHAERAE